MDNNDNNTFGTQCNNILLEQLKTEVTDELSSMLNLQGDLEALNQVFLSGTILGPYLVRKADEGDPEELKFTINDKESNANIFVPMNLDAFNLKRISRAISEESANCRVIFGDQKMFVIVLKTVLGWNKLNAIYVPFDQFKINNFKAQDLAEKPFPNVQSPLSTASLASHNKLNEALLQLTQLNKKFVCTKCSISFTNAGKLKLHQNFYCKETLSMVTDFSNGAAVTPNSDSAKKMRSNTIHSEGDCAPNFYPTTNSTLSAIEAATPPKLNPLPASNVLNENFQAKSLDSGTTTPSNMASVSASVNFLSPFNLLQKTTTTQNFCVDNAALTNLNAPILLPVAYHSHDEPSLVQLIGSAQTVVPVAIHREMPSNAIIFRPLLIDSLQASNIFLPSQHVSIQSLTTNVDSTIENFSLPLSVVTQLPQSVPVNFSSPLTTNERSSVNDAPQQLPSLTSTFFSDMLAQLKSNLHFNNQFLNAENLENDVKNGENVSKPRVSNPFCSIVAGTSLANSGLSFIEDKDKHCSNNMLKREYNCLRENRPLDLSTGATTLCKELSQLNDLKSSPILSTTQYKAQAKKNYPNSKKCENILSLIATRKRSLPIVNECSIENKNKKTDNNSASISLADITANNVCLASSPKRQRLICDCGVSFSVEETLNGHKLYYCRNRVVSAEEKVVPAKSPLQCQLCDFRPSTHSQLSQHTRSVHTQIQSYVCTLCGYKGYSQRGIKSHLRVSHDDEFQKYRLANNKNNNFNLANLVFFETSSPETKEKFSCLKCLRNFVTHELFYRHDCYIDLHESNREHLII